MDLNIRSFFKTNFSSQHIRQKLPSVAFNWLQFKFLTDKKKRSSSKSGKKHFRIISTLNRPVAFRTVITFFSGFAETSTSFSTWCFWEATRTFPWVVIYFENISTYKRPERYLQLFKTSWQMLKVLPQLSLLLCSLLYLRAFKWGTAWPYTSRGIKNTTVQS